MAGKGGGAWKVAYADFVTAMMAFFMVMWITGQSKEVKEAIAMHFTSPFGKFDPGRSMRPPRRKMPFDATGHDQKQKPPKQEESQNGKLPFRLKINQGERTLVGTAVVFQGTSSELDAAAQEELMSFVPELAGKPQKIEIRGHAARRPADATEKASDPWQLSYSRCLTTMKFLEENGIKSDRMRLSQAGPHDARSAEMDGRVEVFLLSEVVRPETQPDKPESNVASVAKPHEGSGG